MTKFKAGVASAFVLAALTTTFVIQHRAAAESSARQQLLREQNDRLAEVLADNQRLASLATPANRSVFSPPSAELSHLRAEADSLRAKIRELTALRDQNRLAEAASESRTPLQIQEVARGKYRLTEIWLQAFLNDASQNGGRLPSEFAQAEPFLPKNLAQDASLASDQFEILYRGSLDALTNKNVILFRERDLWKLRNGDGTYKWGRHYAIADGRVDYCSSSDKSPSGSFDSYEKEHLVAQSRP